MPFFSLENLSPHPSIVLLFCYCYSFHLQYDIASTYYSRRFLPNSNRNHSSYTQFSLDSFRLPPIRSHHSFQPDIVHHLLLLSLSLSRFFLPFGTKANIQSSIRSYHSHALVSQKEVHHRLRRGLCGDREAIGSMRFKVGLRVDTLASAGAGVCKREFYDARADVDREIMKLAASFLLWHMCSSRCGETTGKWNRK